MAKESDGSKNSNSNSSMMDKFLSLLGKAPVKPDKDEIVAKMSKRDVEKKNDPTADNDEDERKKRRKRLASRRIKRKTEPAKEVDDKKEAITEKDIKHEVKETVKAKTKSKLADKFKKKQSGSASSDILAKYKKKSDTAGPEENLRDKYKQNKSGVKAMLDNKKSKSSGSTSQDILKKEKRKKGRCVYLVRGKDRNRPAWHYVLVKERLVEKFKETVASGTIDVADWGEVLESGWGEDPHPDIVANMEKRFGLKD